MSDIRILAGLRDIADTFDLVILDLWGCVHDGIKPFPGALECLHGLKAAGKKIFFVTNNSTKSRKGRLIFS